MQSISGFRWAEPFGYGNLPRGGFVQVLFSMGAPLAWLLACTRANQGGEEYQPLVRDAPWTLHQCQHPAWHTNQRHLGSVCGLWVPDVLADRRDSDLGRNAHVLGVDPLA